MKLNTVIERMPIWYQAGLGIHLVSEPGRGKTTTIEAAPKVIGEKLGLNIGIVVVNAAMLTPTHCLGYGVPDRRADHIVMNFSDPFFFVTSEGKRLTEYDGGILYIDEIDKADIDVKKIVGEGQLSGRFGPHSLPKGWVVWSSGNDEGMRSGSTKKLDHMINRRREIVLTDDPESLADWMLKNGVSHVTTSFAEQYPNVVFEPRPEKQGAWCTPRSLVRVDKYLQLLAGGPDKDFPVDPDTIEEVTGDIGQSAAAQYFAHIRLALEMPSVESIVKSPTTVKVPQKPDAEMLVAHKLAFHTTKDNADKIITYVERMRKEMAVTFAQTACKRDGTLVTTPAFFQWAQRNSSLMAVTVAR